MNLYYNSLHFAGALRERFPNNFMENETFNQFKNGKLQCELFWYYITGGVLLITATILIVVSITMWNKYNEEIVETEEFCGFLENSSLIIALLV